MKYSCRLGHLLEEYMKRQSGVVSQYSDVNADPYSRYVPLFNVRPVPPRPDSRFASNPYDYSSRRESLSTYSTYPQPMPTSVSLPMPVEEIPEGAPGIFRLSTHHYCFSIESNDLSAGEFTSCNSTTSEND